MGIIRPTKAIDLYTIPIGLRNDNRENWTVTMPYHYFLY